MKNYYIFLFVMLFAAQAAQAQVSFTGNSRQVCDIVPEKSTGLNHIYVLYGVEGVSMEYTATSAERVVWYAYSSQGGGYAEEITDIRTQGSKTTLPQVVANQGYIIEEGTKRTYVWVVNYADHYLRFVNIAAAAPEDCGTTTLNIDGTADEIPYFTITGVRKVLNRDIRLTYRTLVWDEENLLWQQVDTMQHLSSIKPQIVVQAPLCNTSFHLAGDRFLQFWNEDVEMESVSYTTTAVDVRATAVEQKNGDSIGDSGNSDDDEADDDSNDEGDQLGGSAPATITFKAYCTDAVDHKEWQKALDPDFQNIEARFNDDEVEQTFTTTGTSYWRFVGTNLQGGCEAYGPTFTVNIGESELQCANVFSPGSTEGVGDVWKVKYKSLVEFHCVIFNTWGKKVCEFSNPDDGWDGKYRGKLVPTGVYYYVIQARGADDKVYKLSGDINILRYSKRAIESTATPE